MVCRDNGQPGHTRFMSETNTRSNAAEEPSGFVSGGQSAEVQKIAEFEQRGHRFVLRCFESLPEISELEAGWQELEEHSCDGFDYFQTFDWCYGWCRSFLSEDNADGMDKPQVYVLSCDERLVLIWPLLKTRSRSGLYFLDEVDAPSYRQMNCRKVVVDE